MTRSSNFSPEAASRAIDFVACLKHPKGTWRGVPFQLTDWQRPDWEQVFGTMVPNPNRDSRRKMIRQYRRWFKGIAKKNGKTEEAAGAAGVLLYADDEYGAEVYSGAASRDQATLVYNTLASMVKQVPALRKRTKFYDSTKRLYVPDTESTFQALSADADYSDGINPSGVVVDELHRHKNRELYDLLKQGSGTREQPLLIVITTAGYDRASVCFEEWEYARKVRDGIVEDPALYVSLYETPAEYTFEQIADDEAIWKLANPALGDFLNIDDLRSAVREAREKPAMRNSVLRLRFNQWTQSEVRWFDTAAWRKCGGLIGDMSGKVCYGGLDLASTTDFAAWVLFFPEGNKVIPRIFIPKDTLSKRTQMREQLEAWANAGHLTLTPGNVIDYDFIKAQILKDSRLYDIREIGYDPWSATQIAIQLEGEGLRMVPVRQGFATLSTPSKGLETLVARGELNHGGHPVLTWMADNVMIETDAGENIKPSRKHSTEKIDGIVALVTAYERAIHADDSGVAPEVWSFTVEELTA
jgi:phage terminase large subunit-like protein